MRRLVEVMTVWRDHFGPGQGIRVDFRGDGSQKIRLRARFGRMQPPNKSLRSE